MRKIVVIPTYNEIENVEDIIHAIFALPSAYHVLIVDDNSPDGTAKRVQFLQQQYQEQLFLLQRPQKNGLGTAYVAGFHWALKRDYDYIFEMDADFSHAPEDLDKLLYACENGADMSIGSRYVTGVNVVNWPLSRVLLSYFASVYVRFITGMDIMDTTAGFVCYKRRVLEEIQLSNIKFVGYAFQIEMKYRTYCKKFVLKEVPIVFTDRTKGQSKMTSGIIKEAIFGVLQLKMKQLLKQL